MSRKLSIRLPGAGHAAPAVGLSVMNDMLVIVTVRHQPLRITGIYRHDLSTVAFAQAAHDTALRKSLRHGRRALRLPRGAAVTVALQPQVGHIKTSLGQTPGVPITARCRPALPRLLRVAGFGSPEYDLLPASLARAALSNSCSSVSFRHRSGWRIYAAPERLEADWCGDTVSGPLTEDSVVLGGVRVPPALEAISHVGLDAGAIGAALGGVGLSPRTCRATPQDVVDLRGTGDMVEPAIA